MSFDVAIVSDQYGNAVLDANAPTGEIEGTLKLAQRVLLELLTEKGSVAYQPLRGCTLVTDFRTRRFGSELDVFTSFAVASIDVVRNLQQEDATDTGPTNEKLQSLRLTKVVLLPGSLVMTVQVSNQAGQANNTVLALATTF